MTDKILTDLNKELDKKPGVTMKEKVPAAPRQISAFRSAGKSFAAGSFKWIDTTFYYREMTDPIEEKLKESMVKVHEWLGVPFEAAEAFFTGKSRVDPFASVDPEKMDDYLLKMEEAYDDILQALIVDWKDPVVDFDLSLISECGLECKTSLVSHIRETSKTGESQSFTRGRLNH